MAGDLLLGHDELAVVVANATTQVDPGKSQEMAWSKPGSHLLGPVVAEDLLLLVIAVGAHDAVFTELAAVPDALLEEAVVRRDGGTVGENDDENADGADDLL